MKFLLNLLALLTLVVVLGCADAASSEGDVKTTIVDGESKTVANLKIEGMSCEQMCAGAIKETLAGIPGVKKCEVNFEEKQATVEYDWDKVTSNDLTKAVTELNGGSYEVTDVDVERFVNRQQAEKEGIESSDGNSESGLKAEQKKVKAPSSVSFPNIFDAFARFYPF